MPGRVKKKLRTKGTDVSVGVVNNRDTYSTKWLHVLGFFVAVVSVLITTICGIALFSSTQRNESGGDIMGGSSRMPPSNRSKTVVYKTGKVKVKTLSSPRVHFAKNCAKGGIPVVLKNNVVKTWQASTSWTPAYLQSKLSSLSGIYENENPWFGPYFDPTKPLVAHATRCNPYKTGITMDVDEFFNLLHRPKKGRYHYFTGSIEALGEWAYSEIQPLDELLLLNSRHSSVNVWIGQPYVIAHCHYDGYHNFYAQLYGKKKFTLFSPTNWPGLYPYPFLHPSHAQCQVNASYPRDVEHFPLIQEVEAEEVILGPGDLLYIPPLWFHEVESQSMSISVNVWTDSHQTELMMKVFSMPLPFESKEMPHRHRHKHLEWRSPHERQICGAIFIHRILNKISEYRTLVDVNDNRFFEPNDMQNTAEMYNQSTYFVLQLWRTRYRDLMRKGELPDRFPEEANILCESRKSKDAEFTLNADADMMKDVHFGSYVEMVGHLVKVIPEETLPVWIGNFVEYVAASVVSDVKYVGLFLKHLNSCTEYLNS